MEGVQQEMLVVAWSLVWSSTARAVYIGLLNRQGKVYFKETLLYVWAEVLAGLNLCLCP